MHDTTKPSTNNWFQVEHNNLKHIHGVIINDADACEIVSSYLSIKHLSSLDGVGGTAEDEARRHLAVIDTLHLDLDILSAGDRGHLDIIWPDLLNLHLRLNDVMDYLMFVKHLINVTLLGITRRGSPFLQAPLSTFPITIVPMSLYLEEKNILLWLQEL